MNIFKLKIEEFLEPLFHLFYLVIFFINCLLALSLKIVHVGSKPIDLLILLLSDFLNSVFNNCLHVLFFINYFPQTSNLKLVLFLLAIKLSFRCFNLPFDFKSLLVLDFKNNLHFRLLRFFSPFFPSVELALHFKKFRLPIHAFGLFVFDIHLSLFKFGFGFTELFVFVIEIWLEST